MRMMLILVLGLAIPMQAQWGEMFENDAESSSTQATAPVVAPAPAKKRWTRFFPSDVQTWKLQVIGSAVVNDKASWERLTTQHIKSGKGVQEFNLAGSMIGGFYEMATLIRWHGKKHHAAPQLQRHRENLP